MNPQEIADSIMRTIALHYGATTRRDFKVTEITLRTVIARHDRALAQLTAERDAFRQLVNDIVTGDGEQLENLDMSPDELNAVLDNEDLPIGISPDGMRRALLLFGALRHGVDCLKRIHVGGELHAASDDGPYDVDGVKYCGRCHAWSGTPSPVPEITNR